MTTKVESDKYQDLLKEKGGRGFPYLVFMDAAGDVLSEHNGPRSVEGFRKTGDLLQRYVALQAKAATGTSADKVELLLLELDLGRIDADDVDPRVAELREHMTEGQLAKVAAKLLVMEIEDAMGSIRSQEQMLATGKRFVGMAADGKIPADDEGCAVPFWGYQLEFAADAKDLKLTRGVVAEIKKRFTDPEHARLITFAEGKVEELEDLQSEDDDDDDDDDDDHDHDHDHDG